VYCCSEPEVRKYLSDIYSLLGVTLIVFAAGSQITLYCAPVDLLVRVSCCGSYTSHRSLLCLSLAVFLLDRIARTTYVDAVYCYRPSSVVCQSVCHSHAKTAEPIEMPFGLRIRVDPENHILEAGPDAA